MSKDLIFVTDSFREWFLKSLYAQNDVYLRFGVTSGGCSGYNYLWEFTSIRLEDDIAIEIVEGSMLLVSATEMPLLRGSTIDYILTDPFSSHIDVSNPNAVANCGCGTSFTVDTDVGC